MSEISFARGSKAFTLIELLIVVAIIAILAAIAVPNFLEAQVRAKASRAKSDMRTMATAMESYYVDNNAYPQCNTRATAIAYGPDATPPVTTDDAVRQVLERISTPISYLSSSILKDAFAIKGRYTGTNAVGLASSTLVGVDPGTEVVAKINSYLYQAVGNGGRAQVATDSFSPGGQLVKANGWFLFSVGPDLAYPNLGGVLANDEFIDGPILLIYDPTNGTVSFGDIYREGGSSNGGGSYWAGKGLREAIRQQR